MQITIELPDDIAAELTGRDAARLPRTLLEMVAIEGYRSGQLTHAQVGRLLGIDYRFDIDAFLQRHGIDNGYTAQDLEQDQRTLRGVNSV
ncbi:MAG: UPF0175 family protein [Armatimonadota bacterium]